MATFAEATREAAVAARLAVNRAMRKYADGLVTDEDDLTGVLIGNLDSAFHGQVGGLSWSSSILRHRKGVAAEEKRIGADMLIHVAMNTPTQTYSKGVLVQAKRIGPDELMSRKDHLDMVGQCNKMLSHTPSSFVFSYSPIGMRCGAATKIAGATERDLYNKCGWTAYRFFLELFRCPVGDPNITTAKVADLPVPIAISLKAEGEFSSDFDR